jgi:LmbE family N-acetylglucosaminyl deacetylase
VLPLALPDPPSDHLQVLALGAHCDDVEIGAGGTLLRLAAERAGTGVVVCALTGGGTAGEEEARAAQRVFAPAGRLQVHDLPDGRLPAHWARVKDLLEALARESSPHVVLAPRRNDAHQDHRLLAELVPTVWRDVLVLGYEIPKWDGDLGRPSHYVPLPEEVAERKWRLLDASYPSQRGRDWWDRETVLGLARLRGVECRARYAEAFEVSKAVLTL